MFNFKLYDWKKYKVSLLVVVIILSVCSVYFVRCALSGEDYADSYFTKQIFGMVISFVLMLVISLIDYHAICQFAAIYYILGVLMAAATKFSPLGTDQGTDSYRWLKFGAITFQPSEVCKLILIISLAAFFQKMREKTDKFSTLVLAGILTAVPTFFILVQSDLSSSLVMMFTFAIMVLAAGVSYKILLPIIAVAIPSFIALFWYIQQPFQKILGKYQRNRILGWLHPEDYEDSIMWQQNHSVTAIASGKVYGKAILGETARNYQGRVDVTESDFIFAVIGEEVGFIGSCIIIALLLYIVAKCLLTARHAKDYLGALIATGISAMFMFQVFANIGVATSLLPNTGLPLPFLSYGLSSTVGSMMAVGVILNIGLQNTMAKEAKV
jgi:rod shape determining protein RodA